MTLRYLFASALVTLTLAGTVLARTPVRPRGVPLDVSVDLGTTALAVADGQLVFANDGKRITAVSVARGQVTWVRELSGWAVGGVVAAGGLVLVGTTDQRVHALDARTGVPRWQAALPARPERIVQVEGTDVLVSAGKRTLVLLDLARGTQRWSHRLEDDLEFAPVLRPRAIVTAGSSEVKVLDRTTGKTRAALEVGLISAELLVTADRVYVTVTGEPVVPEDPYGRIPERPAADAPRSLILTALKLDSLAKAWAETYQPKAALPLPPLAATAAMVLSVTEQGRLTGHYAEHGTARWHQTVKGALLDAPRVVDPATSVVVIGTRAELVAVAVDTGIVKWRHALACPLGSRLHLVGGRVLVQRPATGARYELPAYELATGRLAWKAALPDRTVPSDSPGVIHGSELLLRDVHDDVLRIDATTGKLTPIPVGTRPAPRR